MKEKTFGQLIETSRQCLAALRQRADDLSPQQKALIAEGLEELSTGLKDLYGAGEKIRWQDEKLASTCQALETDRQRYRDLFEFAPHGYLVTDAKGIVQQVNRAAATLLHVRQNFLVGKPLVLFVVGKDRQFFRSQLSRVDSGRVDRLQDWEVRMELCEGAPFPVSITVSAVRDSQGKLVDLHWSLQAIATRKLAEEALRESEARYRAVSELTSDFAYAFYVKPDGSLIREWVTGASSGITGFILDEMTAQEGGTSFIHPKDRQIAFQHLQRHLSGQSDTSEYRILTKSGETRWLRDYGQPVWDEDLGRVVRIIGAVQDITERKGAEEALRESEERYRQLVELSPDGIIVYGVDGKIIFTNTPGAALCGAVSPDQLTGKPFVDFVYPSCRKAVEGRFRRVTEEGEKVPFEETKLCRLDGAAVDVEIAAAPFVSKRQLAVQVVIHDITERKRAEEALRRYADEQATLYAITSTVATSLNPDALLSVVLEVVLSVLDADAGWVVVPGSSLDDSFRVVAWHGVPDALLAVEATRPLHTCPIYERLLAGGEARAEPQLITECPYLPPEVLVSANLHGHVGIPLSVGDKVLGILNIAWQAFRSLAKSDRALLITIGRQVGMALHNAQLYQAARQVDRLRVLNELDEALVATLDPEWAAEVTLRQMASALNAPMGMLFVLPPQADAYLVRIFTLGQGWVETAASEKNVQSLQALLPDSQEGRGAILLPGSKLAAVSEGSTPAHCWGFNGLLVPIWGDGELVAVLVLGGRLSDRPFTEGDRALAQAAAGRAGQAIQNARLYRASQEQSERLATLNAIVTAAVSSLELDTVLQQVLKMTCQALAATRGSILMKEPDTDKLIFAQTLIDEPDALHRQRLAPGQGIAGWVVQHGQAVCVNDVHQDPRFYDGVDKVTGFTTHSLLCAPLKHREEVIGALEVVNKCGAKFTAEDLSLLEAVSSIASVALANARLYTATRAHAAELELLNSIGLALTSTLDFSVVVRNALSQVQHLFQAEHASLIQPDSQTGELYFVQALAKTRPVDIPVRLQPGEGIVGWALEHRQPVLVEDAQDDPRFSGRVDRHLGIETRSLMAVPLLMQEHDLGVIEVISNEPGTYTYRTLNTLQALASTLAVALDNARLYDELKALLHEREQTQAQLIHSEKMAALGRLVASIAHEINNPLQAMQGCLTLVVEEMAGDQRQEKIERYLGILGDEIDRVSAIVRRVRDFYRPARKELQPTDLHALLEDVLALSGKQLQHSNIAVEREWADDLPSVWTNHDHLRQVFLNLLLNAIDAMPQGGKLCVRTALDQIQAYGDQPLQPAVRVEFRDTGEGMSPETQARLFEPFFTTKENGAGLGLYISYEIIKSHDGQIAVTSQVGEGTSFKIVLPVERLSGRRE